MLPAGITEATKRVAQRPLFLLLPRGTIGDYYSLIGTSAWCLSGCSFTAKLIKNAVPMTTAEIRKTSVIELESEVCTVCTNWWNESKACGGRLLLIAF